MKTTAVLLAAGTSARFGSDKRRLVLPGGDALLQACAVRARAASDDVVVVLRPGDADLSSMLDDLGCRVCINTQPQRGMGSSLACGVRAAADADAWMVMPGDLPLLRPQSLGQVAAALHTADAVVPVCHGRRGHPVGFGSRYRQALLALSGDVGGRHVLQGDGGQVVWLNIHDPGIYLDVDTPADVARLARLCGPAGEYGAPFDANRC